jgi:sulfide dehydrogenase [flavocytochrome c] flavoprotein subunit
MAKTIHSPLSRRNFTRLAGASAAGATLAIAGCATGGGPKARVVVIGGGFGGATAAKYVRQIDPSLDVTLVEPSQTFLTCPFSNYVLAGFKTLNDITHNYKALSDVHGVKVVHDTAQAIDPVAKTVRLAGGSTLTYDKLVVSPGIDFRWGGIEGYTEAARRSCRTPGRPARRQRCCGASSRRCKTAAR